MEAPRSAEQRKSDTLTRLASEVDAWIATAGLSVGDSVTEACERELASDDLSGGVEQSRGPGGSTCL